MEHNGEYAYGGKYWRFKLGKLVIWFSDWRENTVVPYRFSLQIIIGKFNKFFKI